jgi:hypothetical protein
MILENEIAIPSQYEQTDYSHDRLIKSKMNHIKPGIHTR